MGGVSERIADTIRAYLCTVLGESSVKVIEYHIARDDANIYTDPNRLQEGLEMLFGDGSKMLIKEVVKVLCNEFSIALDDNVMDLNSVVKMIEGKQGLEVKER